MKFECEIEISEFDIETIKNEEGVIIQHRFYTVYQHFRSPLDLMFAGKDLAYSNLLDDVRLFGVTFWGEPETVYREAWADPLRLKIFQRLARGENEWYFAPGGGTFPDSRKFMLFEDELPERFLKEHNLDYMIVPYMQKMKYVPEERRSVLIDEYYGQIVFETRKNLLPEFVQKYLPRVEPGEPNEGYCLRTGQIELLRQWNEQPKDDKLFRQVMDEIQIAFFTFPSEPRHFIFITNKYTFEKFVQTINLEDLNQHAKEIERDINTKLENGAHIDEFSN
ncbi:MAG: hypothetical protein H6636_01250 [Anaerolineales bacterium]|nr:hypothetical protein [Anaerolineales bacterium]